MSALKYWIWLSSLSGVGAVTVSALLSHYGAPEKVYSADSSDYKKVEGIKSSDISGLMKKNLEPAEKILASCADIGCRIICLSDAEYPERLRNIFGPPSVLYVRGYLPVIDDEPVFAVVGTRTCSSYGLKFAENTCNRLARSGFIITTGLAKGIDSAAARGALRGGGRVVGVIGSGLDVVYPPENKNLFDEVAASGAIISEYPPGSPALATHFPARNRIISGLSLGVAVIEAPKKSGALITAARALEQGRDVFALPGNVDSVNSEGTNLLLREGAIPLLSAEDILNEYEGMFSEQKEMGMFTEQKEKGMFSEKKEIDNIPKVEYIDLDEILNPLTGDERLVAKTIGAESLHVDTIIVNSGLPAPQVLTALTMLEIKGYIKSGGGKHFSLIQRAGGPPGPDTLG